MNESYKDKYLKYKNKYFNLVNNKIQKGGSDYFLIGSYFSIMAIIIWLLFENQKSKSKSQSQTKSKPEPEAEPEAEPEPEPESEPEPEPEPEPEAEPELEPEPEPEAEPEPEPKAEPEPEPELEPELELEQEPELEPELQSEVEDSIANCTVAHEPKTYNHMPTLEGSNILKLIGPVSAYQYIIKINGINRNILLLGDVHESLHSCHLPSDEWIDLYKEGLINNLRAANEINKEFGKKPWYKEKARDMSEYLRPIYENIKKFFEAYVENIKFNPNSMYIYDYMLLLAKGDVCIDFYNERHLFSQISNVIVEDDVFMDIRIYYAKILHNFLNFCGKTISVSNKNRISLEDYIIRGSDQKWCIRNYPSLRYHQVDIRGIRDTNFLPSYFNVNFNKPIDRGIYCEIIRRYLTILFDNRPFNYEYVFGDIIHVRLKTEDNGEIKLINIDGRTIQTHYSVQYNLVQKQYRKSVFFKMKNKSKIVEYIYNIICNEELPLIRYFELQTRIMDFYVLFRLFIDKWNYRDSQLSEKCKTDYPLNSICFLGDNHIKHIYKFVEAIFKEDILVDYKADKSHSEDCCSGINLNENTDKSKDIVNTQLRVLHNRCVEIITN